MKSWGEGDSRATVVSTVRGGSIQNAGVQGTRVETSILWLCSHVKYDVIVSGASPSVGRGGTLLLHPFRACMIAAAIMIGEYLFLIPYLFLNCGPLRTLALFTTYSFSVIYVLHPLFAFSYRKSLAAASHCPPCVSICVHWCQLSAPHRQPCGLVEGDSWSAFAKDMQNHCWLQWVFVFRVTDHEWQHKN